MTYAPIQGKCPACHQDSANTSFQAGAASRDAEVSALEFSWAGCSQQLKDACADLEEVEQECDQLSAQINRLLDAVKVIETDSEEVLDFDECTAMCIPMDTYHGLIEAAEATCEQSIAAYRNKVIEECAVIADMQHEGYAAAVEIRAMKEQP